MEAADLARENALLKARLAEVEATLAETQEANRRLQDILHAAQREKFGKRSEKLSPDQFNLPLEDAEFAQGVLEAAQEKAEAAMQRARGETPRKPKRNRGHLPSHLPRVERVIEPDEPKFSGVVFKVQANMDPAHRDRVAQLCFDPPMRF